MFESLEARRLFAAYLVDKGFGTAGVLDTANSTIGDVTPSQTLMDKEGRVILVTPYTETSGARKLAIRRYHADGSIDKSWDGDGSLTLLVANNSKQPDPLVTLLNDNSLVIAMRQPTVPLLQRYTVKGNLDTSFGKRNAAVYKTLKVGEVNDRVDHLYTDELGRAVFVQYLSHVWGFDTNATSTPDERIWSPVSRFLPDGSADYTFGVRGGFSSSEKVDSPFSYKVEGKVLNRRGSIEFTEPVIDGSGNVIVAGSRAYARGSTGSHSTTPYSSVQLPLVHSFARDGTVNRKYIAAIDVAKATFVNNILQYTGVETDAANSAVTNDGTLYVSGKIDSYHYGKGLAVFAPSGNTFSVSGFDKTFETAWLERYGNQVWSVEIGFRGVAARLSAINPDATTGETLGIGRTFDDIRFKRLPAFLPVSNRPTKIVGFIDSTEQKVRVLSLIDQSGSATLSGTTIKVTGTAGEDYIDVRRRADGRIVVTGAGGTRSFPKTVTKLEANLAGGDDSFIVGTYGLKLPVAVYGEAGDDYIRGMAGDDFLSGGSGNDTLVANEGNDTVYGDSGNDSLEGNGGIDKLFGGSGTDSSFVLKDATYDSIEIFT